MRQYPVHRLAMALLGGGMVLLAQQGAPLPKPGPRDACPVCGMLVAKYPNWLATVVWKDGRSSHFDGAKDLLKFLQAPGAFAPGRNRGAVRDTWVTEFYGLKRIRAETAWFVLGSDVLGPMGHELVPLETSEDAVDFMKDHGGRRRLRFGEITTDVLKKVDAGQF